MANSVNPDQTPHSVASDLGLHCLQRPIYLGFFTVHDTLFLIFIALYGISGLFYMMQIMWQLWWYFRINFLIFAPNCISCGPVHRHWNCSSTPSLKLLRLSQGIPMSTNYISFFFLLTEVLWPSQPIRVMLSQFPFIWTHAFYTLFHSSR